LPWLHPPTRVTSKSAHQGFGRSADGKPAQILEHSGPDSNPIKKIVHEIVYMPPPGQNVTIDNALPADDRRRRQISAILDEIVVLDRNERFIATVEVRSDAPETLASTMPLWLRS
jgi:hypothetical protein